MSFETFQLLINFLERLHKLLKCNKNRNMLIALCEAIEDHSSPGQSLFRAALDLRKTLQAGSTDGAELLSLMQRLITSGKEDLEEWEERIAQEEEADLPDGWDDWLQGVGQ